MFERKRKKVNSDRVRSKMFCIAPFSLLFQRSIATLMKKKVLKRRTYSPDAESVARYMLWRALAEATSEDVISNVRRWRCILTNNLGHNLYRPLQCMFMEGSSIPITRTLLQYLIN